jgi:hypothetical protein
LPLNPITETSSRAAGPGIFQWKCKWEREWRKLGRWRPLRQAAGPVQQ